MNDAPQPVQAPTQGSMDNSVKAGTRIDAPAPGGVFPWLAQRLGLDKLVRAANSWLNLRVILRVVFSDGTSAQQTVLPSITDSGSTITLPIDLTTIPVGPSGGGITVSQFTFDWDAGDYIVCTPVATQPNLTPSMSFNATTPYGVAAVVTLQGFATYQWTPGANDYSLVVPSISGSPFLASGGVQTFRLPNSGPIGAYLTGTPSTTSGSVLKAQTVAILKPSKLRKSIASETIPAVGGVAHSYTYAATNFASGTWSGLAAFYTRTNSYTPTGGALTTEPEVVTPDYLPGDLILAIPSGEDTLYTLADLNRDGRAWASTL